MTSVALIHGLPGAGKTSLCQELRNLLPEFYYADLAKHPGFGTSPMTVLCAQLYLEQGRGRSLLTEGVLSKRRKRDEFVRLTSEHIEARSKVVFSHALIIFLDEAPESLSTRRNRSTSEYINLRDEVELGSFTYEYEHYRCGLDDAESLAERALKISRLIRSRLND